MNLKEKALWVAARQFECIGFTSAHARVLRALSEVPQSMGEVAKKTGLFQYCVRETAQDLLGLDLIGFTRNGIHIYGEWEMLERLTQLCEECKEKDPMEFEAAFDVVHPKVIALKKKWDFE